MGHPALLFFRLCEERAGKERGCDQHQDKIANHQPSIRGIGIHLPVGAHFCALNLFPSILSPIVTGIFRHLFTRPTNSFCSSL